MNLYNRTFVIALLVIPSASSKADMLWDQYTRSGIIDAIVDQEFSDAPAASLYVVGDVTVGSEGWHVDSVSTLVSIPGDLAFWQTNVTTGRLNIFTKTAALPGAGD